MSFHTSESYVNIPGRSDGDSGQTRLEPTPASRDEQWGPECLVTMSENAPHSIEDEQTSGCPDNTSIEIENLLLQNEMLEGEHGRR